MATEHELVGFKNEDTLNAYNKIKESMFTKTIEALFDSIDTQKTKIVCSNCGKEADSKTTEFGSDCDCDCGGNYEFYVHEKKDREDVTFINLTPHNITIEGIGTLESSGVARVNMKEEKIGTVNGVEIIRRKSIGIDGLPSEKDNTIYIVSSMVLDETNRSDVMAPDTGSTCNRNDKGHIVSITRLVGK